MVREQLYKFAHVYLFSLGIIGFAGNMGFRLVSTIHRLPLGTGLHLAITGLIEPFLRHCL